MKIIAVGDLHLGKRPSRLPGELQDVADRLGPAAAWAKLVEASVRERMNAVVLAGDVVENENDFFEAYRVLAKGLETLADAKIPVFGVSGNHDVLVLPRLVEHFSGHFHLLGHDGRWEKVKVCSGDGEVVTLWGRSFRGGEERDNPLRDTEFHLDPGINIGILHCDKDQSKSRYAPVSSSDLRSVGMNAWLLGHIHKPDRLEPPAPLGYLGSVTALDPTETGAHGPWAVSIQGGSICEVRQWSLAPLRWEFVEVNADGMQKPEELKDRLLRRVHELDGALTDGPWIPEAVGLHVMLRGSTSFRRLEDKMPEDVFFVGKARTRYFIGTVISELMPEIALNELAKEPSPAGLLAQRLMLLDRPSEDAERRVFLRRFLRVMEESEGDPRWASLGLLGWDEEKAAESLKQTGLRLLREMLPQREEQP